MKYDLEELLQEKENVKPSKKLDQTVLHILEEKTYMKQKHNKPTNYAGKIAAAVLAGVLATGGVVYAASQLWNQDVAEQFGVKENQETMKELNKQGFANIPTSTKETPIQAEDQDIKVKVLQTLADEQTAYIYFEVDYGNRYKAIEKQSKAYPDKHIPDTGISNPNVKFLINGDSHISYCGEAVEIKNAHTITYAYQILANDQKLKDAKIDMIIHSFEIDHEKADTKPEIISKGNWDLSWTLSNGTTKHVYTLNKKLTLNNTTITLKSLELSPLSCKLFMDPEDYAKISNLNGIVKGTGKEEPEVDKDGNYIILRYENDSSTDTLNDSSTGTQELSDNEEIICLNTLSEIFLGDKSFDGLEGIALAGDTSIDAFSKILDINKVTGFRFAGQKIDLTDCNYKTVDCFSNK